ncbi:RHS repeat protein [bacterium]|nr:RHS repeat protein [bacterium]
MVDKKNTQSQKTTQPAPTAGSKNSVSALVSIGVGAALAVTLIAVYVKNKAPEQANAQPEWQTQTEKSSKDAAETFSQAEPVQRASQRVQQEPVQTAKTSQPDTSSDGRSHAGQQSTVSNALVQDEQPVQSAVPQDAPVASGKTSAAPVSGGSRTRPYSIDTEQYMTTKVQPVTVAQLSADNPNKYKPITAADIVPQKQAVEQVQLDPEVEKILKNARAEEKLSRSQPQELPEELAGEDVSSIGQASFPDGSRWMIVYNADGNPSKILEIASDGSKLLKELNSQGNVVSITQNGKRQVFVYEQVEAGKTQVTVLDDAGKPQQVRTYNDRGLLTAMKDTSGQSFTYTYSFDQGEPAEYTKQTASGKTVERGKYADIEALQFDALRIFTTGMVTMYSYEYREDGSIKEIIENKGKENEVARALDVEGRIVSVTRKMTGETFIYKYDQGTVVEIIVVSQDGSRRSVDPSSDEFALIESETGLFDPVVFSETINRHKDMQKYLNVNRQQQVIADAQRAQNLATADTFKGPAQAVTAPVQKVQSATAYKAPAKAPAKPVSVPR